MKGYFQAIRENDNDRSLLIIYAPTFLKAGFTDKQIGVNDFYIYGYLSTAYVLGKEPDLEELAEIIDVSLEDINQYINKYKKIGLMSESGEVYDVVEMINKGGANV